MITLYNFYKEFEKIVKKNVSFVKTSMRFSHKSLGSLVRIFFAHILLAASIYMEIKQQSKKCVFYQLISVCLGTVKKM